jgi:hypothetical protein
MSSSPEYGGDDEKGSVKNIALKVAKWAAIVGVGALILSVL